MASDDDNQNGNINWRQAVGAVGLALAIPWLIGVPALLGWYVDRSYGTWPLWFLIGLFVGLFSAAFDVYRLLKRFGQFK